MESPYSMERKYDMLFFDEAQLCMSLCKRDVVK